MVVGPDYFKRFVKNADGTRVRFKTSKEVNEYMNKMIDVDKWMRDVKFYVKEVDAELIADKKLVFGIETKIFWTYTEEARQFSVVVGLVFILKLFNSYLEMLAYFDMQPRIPSSDECMYICR